MMGAMDAHKCVGECEDAIAGVAHIEVAAWDNEAIKPRNCNYELYVPLRANLFEVAINFAAHPLSYSLKAVQQILVDIFAAR